MRIRRMGGTHLLDDRERVGVLCGCNSVDEHGCDGVAVRFRAGGQPQRDRGEITETPDRLFVERFAAERRKELREMRQIFCTSG